MGDLPTSTFVFQLKPILQVIEEVLAPYAPYVRWRIDTGVDTLLADLAPRPMIGQYQESDYTLITRLLAEEGLGWSVVESSAQGSDAASDAARGVHLLPRIGQEVLVGFLHGQMDQPIVLAVLASAYNGRGEGSRLPQEYRADLADSPVVTAPYFAEAIQYRRLAA